MIDKDFLKILVCPETAQSLSVLDSEALKLLNDKIAKGQLANRSGMAISEQVDAALIREDGEYLYLVRDDIPIMLIEEAVKSSDIDEASFVNSPAS